MSKLVAIPLVSKTGSNKNGFSKINVHKCPKFLQIVLVTKGNCFGNQDWTWLLQKFHWLSEIGPGYHINVPGYQRLYLVTTEMSLVSRDCTWLPHTCPWLPEIGLGYRRNVPG